MAYRGVLRPRMWLMWKGVFKHNKVPKALGRDDIAFHPHPLDEK